MDSELDRRFGFVLYDVSRLLRKRFDRRAHGLGLTRAQRAAIAHLCRLQLRSRWLALGPDSPAGSLPRRRTPPGCPARESG